MILLHDQKVVIMTLPKCATNSLHALFRRKKWNGETYVGPSTLGDDTLDRHVNRWPHEVRRYRKLVTVRNPYNRLVSLYLHLASREAGHGRASPDFQTFAEGVVTGNGEFQDWFKWNLTKWLEGIQYDEFMRTEHLMEDLEKAKLKVANIPFLNKNYRAQNYSEFYTPEIMAMVLPWCQPDCETFGYELQPQPSPL